MRFSSLFFIRKPTVHLRFFSPSPSRVKDPLALRRHHSNFLEAHIHQPSFSNPSTSFVPLIVRMPFSFYRDLAQEFVGFLFRFSGGACVFFLCFLHPHFFSFPRCFLF